MRPLMISSACWWISGVKSTMSAAVIARRAHIGQAGLLAKGCGLEVFSLRARSTAAPAARRSATPACRSPGRRCRGWPRLSGSATAWIGFAIDGDVDQQGRRGHVVVPDRMMGQPGNTTSSLPLAHRSSATTESPRTDRCLDGRRHNSRRWGLRSAGSGRCGLFRSAVIEAQVLVLPLKSAEFFFQLVVTELTLLRDVVEGPHQLAGLHIEGAGQMPLVLLFCSRGCELSLKEEPSQDGGAHDGWARSAGRFHRW